MRARCATSASSPTIPGSPSAFTNPGVSTRRARARCWASYEPPRRSPCRGMRRLARDRGAGLGRAQRRLSRARRQSDPAARQHPRAMPARLRALLLAVTFAAGTAAVAQEAAPEALVRSITDDVVSALKRDKAIQAGDNRRLAELVEARILPYFDFRRTTQIAMGAYWRHAT